MQRRQFIKSGVFGAVAVVLAGCTGGSSDGGSSGGETNGSSDDTETADSTSTTDTGSESSENEPTTGPGDTEGSGTTADGTDTTSGTNGSSTATDAGSGDLGDGPIKIGSLHALAPPLAEPAEQERRGMRLAVRQVNEAGGIAGRQVEASYDNTNADPKTALEKARNLVSGEGVSMLYGATLGPSALSISGYTTEQQVPYFHAASLNALSRADCSKSTFNLNVDEAMRSKAIVPTILDRTGGDGWLQVFDIPWGQNIQNGMDRALSDLDTDSQVVNTTVSGLQETDFSNVISQIASSDADWVYIGMGGGGLSAFLKQADQFNLRDQVDLYGASAGQPARQAAGSAITGLIAHSRYTPLYESDVNKRFREAFMAEYDVPPNQFAKDAWEALHLYKAAVEEVGTTDYEAVVGGIEEAEIEGPMGPVSMRACDHRVLRPIHIGEIIDSDQYEAPVAEVIETIDGTETTIPCEETGCSF